MFGSTSSITRINRKRRMEKFVDLCVVNKTCISLTTVTEKNPFTAKLAYEVKETNNSLTSNTPGSSLPQIGSENTPGPDWGLRLHPHQKDYKRKSPL